MNNPERFWDRAASGYDSADERPDEAQLRMLQKTRKYLNARDVVLDFGCATGANALELAGYVGHIEGIDISSKMIELATDRAIERGIKNATFQQATLPDAPYEAGTFDVVMAFNVLHLLDDRRTVIQRIADLLKPGGYFISITPCLKEKKSFATSLTIPFLEGMMKLGLLPDMLTRLSMADLEYLIAIDQFEVVETEAIFQSVTEYFMVVRKGLPDAHQQPGKPS